MYQVGVLVIAITTTLAGIILYNFVGSSLTECILVRNFSCIQNL